MPDRDFVLGDEQDVEERLGERVDISGLNNEADIEKVNALVFELYKEAVTALNGLAHVVESAEDKLVGINRNQAICVGLLVRIFKFMFGVVELGAKRNRLELVQVLNRCILETALNLEFLVTANEERYYEQFVNYSFAPERELYDIIQANIKARNGTVLPIEERMLVSIQERCKASGISIEDVDPKHREWATSVRERLKRVGKEEDYVMVSRIPSHSIHGSWMDLLSYHLQQEEDTGLFAPDNRFSEVDARSLGPIAVWVLDAVGPYVHRFFTPGPESEVIVNRIADLRDRLLEAEAVHERLYNG